MKEHRYRLCALAVAAAFGLAACGGGSGGGTSAPAAMINAQVTDAPTKDFDHVWVTVREFRLHQSNDVPANDPNWQSFPLSTPMTLDLASLYNGNLASLFAGQPVQPGTYQQIRLVLVSDNAPLTNSAQSAGLTYNDQVDWSDANGSHIAPLEIASPLDGVGLNGTFTLVSGATLNLVVDFDIGHDVVKFIHGGNNAYTLKPNLQYFDLAQAGAVTGSVATTNLCSMTGAVVATEPSTCAYNLVIKAEQMSADLTHHVATRYTTIDASGNFTLYPVRVPPGSTSTNIDVLVRGRNMDTILVRGVPVNAGTSPASNPTVLSSSPLPLNVDGNEYLANASAALSPTGAWINFYQTLSATGQAEVPYEIRYRHLNPFTGMFTDDIALSLGPIDLGTYVPGGSPTLNPNSPTQGPGGFLVAANDLGYQWTTNSTTLTGTAGGTSTFTFANPLPVALGATADSISGNIAQAVAGTYDSGYLVVVRMGTIVTTIPISAILTSNGGAGGAYTVTNLPGGSAAQRLPGAFYYLYARVWNSANPITTLKRIDVSGFADLRTGSATGMNVTLN